MPVDSGPSTVSRLGLSPAFVLSPPPPSPAAAIVEQSKRPARLRSVVVVGGPGFAYPVVLGLPLLLLCLGGYLGWALTRPVATTGPGSSA